MGREFPDRHSETDDFMRFEPTRLPGVFRVTSEPSADERGRFARLYCQDEFRGQQIDFTPVQVNLSTNTARHTLRGLHFQRAPHAEAKLVRCLAGSIWDVAVDLRPGPGFGRWQGFHLDGNGLDAVYLPEGVAHGFLTLTDETTLLYQMGKSYQPGHAAGIRWDDPDLAIEWPCDPSVISKKDLNLPFLRDISST